MYRRGPLVRRLLRGDKFNSGACRPVILHCEEDSAPDMFATARLSTAMCRFEICLQMGHSSPFTVMKIRPFQFGRTAAIR